MTRALASLLVAAVLATLAASPALAAGTGVISGTVTKPGGAPAANVYVELHRAAPDVPWLAEQRTDSDGRFAFTGLDDGSYKLRYRPRTDLNLLAEWYADRPTGATAAWLTVTGGSTVTADAELREGGVVTGRVNDGGGPPKESILVYASRVGDGGGRTTHTQPDGSFRIIGLPSASYYLSFFGNYYFTTIFDGASTFADADPVAVTAGQTAEGIDTAMRRGGRISGRVRSGFVPGLEGLDVRLYDAAGQLLATDRTNVNGFYGFGPLETGGYRLEFVPPIGSYPVGEFYDDAPSLGDADPVAVEPGVTTTANGHLLDGGAIAGRVTFPDGAPVAYGKAIVYDSSNAIVERLTLRSDGGYVAGRLPAGDNYTIRFTGEYGLPRERAGVDVSVRQMTRVDVQLEPAGVIRGTARGEGGAPLSGARVYLVHEGGRRAGPFTTDASGRYKADGLRPGRWKVYFNAPNSSYASSYYDAKPSLADADFVTVAERATVSGVDGTLARSP